MFDLAHGWGMVKKVRKNTDYPIEVSFDNMNPTTYTKEGCMFPNGKPPTLSFTEYTKSRIGFSQVRPHELGIPFWGVLLAEMSKVHFPETKRYFDPSFGWGDLVEIDEVDSTLAIRFDDREDEDVLFYSFEGVKVGNNLPSLSTEDYTKKGEIQTMKFPFKPTIGKLYRFWDGDKPERKILRYGVLKSFDPSHEYPYETLEDEVYEHCEAIPECLYDKNNNHDQA